MVRKDGKIAKTVYTGSGVKSVEYIDPPAKKKAAQKTEKVEGKKG